ncbi:(2Fe-2S)-binding protein [Stella sp.]|jgi:hypothetical protein|uniref:(2Fe-2S)-binding protein n=1 Tax=Stella sp. TaxID=2912054 RepID=UPI0035ADADAD
MLTSDLQPPADRTRPPLHPPPPAPPAAPAARFRSLGPEDRLVPVTVDGRTLHLPEGMPLAAALLTRGHAAFHRSVRRDEPRGPWCLMGTCLQCIATVDGRPQVRTCRTPVAAGMVVTLAGSPP